MNASNETTLLTLAARVERLTGPDRVVDAEIARACDWTEYAEGSEWQPPGRGDWVELPEFTGSTDAAEWLIHLPTHPLWTLRTETQSHGQHGITYTAELCVAEFYGYSRANLACAITAAALRARAEGGDRG